MKKEILDIISISWKKETCYPTLQEHWSDLNPSLGQCAITSLVVNDFCGGKIMRCMVDGISHYYNLINGQVVDLTIDQFQGIIPNYEDGEERTREYLLSNEDTKNRYKILLINVRNNFIKYETTDYIEYLHDDSEEYNNCTEDISKTRQQGKDPTLIKR